MRAEFRSNAGLRDASAAEMDAMGRLELTILIVEKDVGVAHHLADALERDGHHVTLSHSAGSAVAYVHAHSPDVVLLDLGLPDSDGHDAARVLRQEVAAAVIIGMARDMSDVSDKVEPFLDLHLVKPVDRDLLSGLLVFLYEKRSRAARARVSGFTHRR